MKEHILKPRLRELVYRSIYPFENNRPIRRYVRDKILQRQYHKQKDVKTVPLEQLQFSLHLVDHCNLNCIGCDHFSPLASPWFADLYETERDLLLLHELIGEKCRYVHLFGGEPLLHPQINDFIHLVRKYFPNSDLCILTNGTLLPRMADYFFTTCLEERVQIRVTRYPINFDYDKVLNELQHRGIDVRSNEHVEKTMYMTPLSRKKDQDATDSFILCHRSNNCITLRDGKLFTCPMISVIHILNQAFQTQYEVGPEDYIDLNTVRSYDEIMTKLASPSSFCGYCKMRDMRFGIHWRTSKRVPEEWIAEP